MTRTQKTGAAIVIAVVATATSLHSPFGGYTVDDGLYSRIEFLRLTREAFPEYADLADGDLLEKVIARYPAATTWIREETNGTPPLALAIVGQEANYRLRPPPAYFGSPSRRYSAHAIYPWIDEPAEYIGVVGPTIVAGVIWIWLFRRRTTS